MEKYEVIGRIGEGAHGIVLKAKRRKTEDCVALKKVALRSLSDGIPNVALREIKSLQLIDSCPYVVRLHDVFPHGSGFVLVFDYMASDLSELLRTADSPLNPSHTKAYMLMLLSGVEVLHANGIMHRDLKPANLLISADGILKIADFGLARIYEDADRLYSHQVATRWYRAPELLYGARNYTNGIDLWAIGCIFGELLDNSPLFPGENDIEQLWFVTSALGAPDESCWKGLTDLPDYNKITFNHREAKPFECLIPDAPPEAVDMLRTFLVYNPQDRCSAKQALMHHYFLTEPLPTHKSELPHPNPHRIGSPSSIIDQQQLYESCLTKPLDQCLVGHDRLKPGLHLHARERSMNAHTVPVISHLQVAVPLTTKK